MKFNIYINQKVLAGTDLDLIDAAILDYLYFLGNSKNEKVENCRIGDFTWVDYKTILEDNPLLRIKSKGAVTPRIKKIEKAGFIETKLVRKSGHKYLYFRAKAKIDNLFIQMNGGEKPIHTHEKPIHTDEPIKTTSNNTTSKHMCVSKQNNSFEEFWTAYPKKTGKKVCLSLWESRKLVKSKEIIISFIEKAKNTDRWKKGFIKDPATFIRQESWEDDLSSYGGSNTNNVYKNTDSKLVEAFKNKLK